MAQSPDSGEVPIHICRWDLAKTQLGGEVESVSVLVAIGVNEEGYREIIGVSEGMKEDRESWRSFFRYLKQRGLQETDLVISDKSLGLIESAKDS